MIAEGEFVKAERLVSRALRMLEGGDEHALLAETLTTQGVVLAGLHKYEQAHSALIHASEVAEQAGDLESAGLASITLIEQLGHRLSNEQLCSTIERASTLLEKCRHLPLIRRLEKVERQSLFLTNAYPGRPNWDTFILEEVQQRNECHYVELALKDSHGSVTKAAQLLSLPGHSSVTFILHTRCQHLIDLRKPIKPRHRSIIQSDVGSDRAAGDDQKASPKFKILHVEDSEIIAGVVKETLEDQGWQVETCANGEAALEKISSEADYDLLLIDYDLPGVNGLELVRHARNLGHRSHTPIVMLSASLVEAAAREAGADMFLQKPRDIASLIEAITRLLEDHEQER